MFVHGRPRPFCTRALPWRALRYRSRGGLASFREEPEAVWYHAGVVLDVVIRTGFQARVPLFGAPAASGDAGAGRAYASSRANGNRHAAPSYSWSGVRREPPRAREAPVTRWLERNGKAARARSGANPPGAAGCCPRTDRAARRDGVASMARFAERPLSIRKFTICFPQTDVQYGINAPGFVLRRRAQPPGKDTGRGTGGSHGRARWQHQCHNLH